MVRMVRDDRKVRVTQITTLNNHAEQKSISKHVEPRGRGAATAKNKNRRLQRTIFQSGESVDVLHEIERTHPLKCTISSLGL